MEILISYKEIIFKLILSAFLGGLIGFERDKRGRAAGLRTHILVSLGSALFMLVSSEIFQLYKNFDTTSVLRIDPGRIAAQIITGIGFIGAGAILRSGFDIKGLTTAGCIWVSAGIGMAVGVSYYIPAIITTFIALFVLVFLRKIELIYFKDAYVKMELYFKDENNILENFKNFLKEQKMDLRLFEFEKNYIKKQLVITIILKLKYRTNKNYYSKKFVEHIEKRFKNDLESISWKEPED